MSKQDFPKIPQDRVPTVYLAGPMRGITNLNQPTFDALAQRWRDAGWRVFNPSDRERAMGFSDAYEDPKYLRHVILLDVIDVLNSDAVALLPGWAGSRGATVEVALAQFAKLPLYDAVTMRRLYPPICPYPPGDFSQPGLLSQEGVEGDWQDVWRTMSSRYAQQQAACNMQRPLVAHSTLDIAITGPGIDQPPAARCGYCGVAFCTAVEPVQTLDASGNVTLCQPCYAAAGNRVR